MSRHVSVRNKRVFQYLPIMSLKTLVRIHAAMEHEPKEHEWSNPKVDSDVMMDIGNIENITREKITPSLETRCFGQHNLKFGLESPDLD